MTAPPSARLKSWQVQLLCWSGGLLWLSGIAWLLLHHFGQVQGEFGPEANPFEVWMLRLHGAAMVAALLGAGGLLVSHVWAGWRMRSQRVLGLSLTIATALLILTGYLLYYIGDERWRSWTSIAHWVIGLAILLLFLLHYRQAGRIRRR